jgi:hypothetical protein
MATYTQPQLCTFIAPKEQHLLITISTARASEISAVHFIASLAAAAAARVKLYHMQQQRRQNLRAF